MSNDMQTAWSGIKEIIQIKWSKLSNAEVESVKNNLDGLVQKIQTTYGFARGRAEREYHEFRVSLKPILVHRSTNEKENFRR